MTVRVVYPEAKYIKSIIDSLSKLVDEVSITIDQDGLYMKALDPARAALIDIYLPASSFLEYEVEEPAEIGLSMANLGKLLKRIKKGDSFELSVDEDWITIIINAAIKRKYRFRNMDVTAPEIPETQLEFNVEAQVLADVIKHAIKDAEVVGDTLEIDAPSEDMLILRGKGATVTETRLTRDAPALIDLRVKAPSRSPYSIEYLKHVLALTKIAETVMLRFSTDMPLYMEFALTGEGRVKYLLAPKAI